MPRQISMAWMLCKKLGIVPISNTHKADQLEEKAGATDVKRTDIEMMALDDATNTIPKSAAFGGARLNVK
jgi:aryl-alcohol dehydrogenase-like predicted oxidoreductase